MKSSTLVFVAASLTLSACDGIAPERDELARNRALWEATGPGSYEYAVERLCFCGSRGPARVTVENGIVSSVVPVSDDDPSLDLTPELFPGVDGLFDILENAVARDAYSIEVTYDPDSGVPLEFFIDYEENIVDEELGMRVTEPVTARAQIP